MIIRPAYDCDTRTWFVEEPRCEAPTITALIAGIRMAYGISVRVEGYHPKGFDSSALTRIDVNARSREADRITEEKARASYNARDYRCPRAEISMKIAPRKRRFDHDLIRQLCKTMTRAQVAKQIGCSPATVDNAMDHRSFDTPIMNWVSDPLRAAVK